MNQMDDLRTLLMCEPRGHSAMSGAILQPPTRPDCDFGVLFIEVSGCLPMCGHGTIGVATVLVETGMVEVIEPVTRIRLDTPAGLVVADVAVEDGAAPQRHDPERAVVLGGARPVGRRPGSRAGSTTTSRSAATSTRSSTSPRSASRSTGRPSSRSSPPGSRSWRRSTRADRPVHPKSPEISGCHHVYFVGPGSTAEHSRHAMAIYPGWFDRSPCGTGTSARMAQLHARGELPLEHDFVNESFIGTRFIGRLIGETTGRRPPRRSPTITGRAWVTGTAQYLLDPTDPFPAGFTF